MYLQDIFCIYMSLLLNNIQENMIYNLFVLNLYIFLQGILNMMKSNNYLNKFHLDI